MTPTSHRFFIHAITRMVFSDWSIGFCATGLASCAKDSISCTGWSKENRVFRWRQNPWLSENMLIEENSWSSFLRNIVLSPVRRPMGFRSSRRYHPNQKNVIYNLRVVPDLQISKKVEFLMIYIFFTFVFAFCFWNFLGIKIQCNLGRERLGEAETGSKWSDGLSERFGMVFGKKFNGKTMKIYDFPCFSVDFPRFSRITNQGFRSLRELHRLCPLVRTENHLFSLFFLRCSSQNLYKNLREP